MRNIHLYILTACCFGLFCQSASAQFLGPYLLPPVPVLNSLVIDDIDNNHTPDLLIGRADSVAALGWYSNNGIGQFGSLNVLSADGDQYDQVITGDLDQDNDPDLILIQGGLIYWRANNGSGSFGDTILVGAATLLYQAIDLTGDEYPEIIATDGASPYFLRNDGFGSFVQQVYLDFIANNFTPFFNDIDQDGDPDLFRLDGASGGIFWYKNFGNGVFGAKTFIGSASSSTLISLVDMDADGDSDVLAARPGQIRWFANEGGGVFNSNPQVIDSNLPFYIPIAEAADFDLDGDNDVFVALLSDPVLNEPERGHFRYYENLGGGLFAIPDSFGLAAGIQRLLLNDIDYDGDTDVGFRTDSIVGWWENLLNPAMISGACFWDKNENKAWDAGEPYAYGLQLNLHPTGWVTYTDSEGEFRFFVAPGNYLLSYETNGCW